MSQPRTAKMLRWWAIVGAGYLVVGVFAFGYFVAAVVNQEVGTNVQITVGVLLAAPLVVAFLWDRLGIVKLLGVEVTLNEATIEVPSLGPPDLEDAFADQQYFSGHEEILKQISQAVHAPTRRLLEINLRSKPYWWSTRLYLEAALLVDHSQVQYLVFVEADARRCYLGMTTPRDVVQALVEDTPCLESTYKELAAKNLSIEDLIKEWAHTARFDGQSELDAMSRIGGHQLRTLLGARLDTTAVHKDGCEGLLLQYQILDRRKRFVPVLNNGQLERVVDANSLARRWSLAALERELTVR